MKTLLRKKPTQYYIYAAITINVEKKGQEKGEEPSQGKSKHTKLHFFWYPICAILGIMVVGCMLFALGFYTSRSYKNNVMYEEIN